MIRSANFKPDWYTTPGDTILDILEHKELSSTEFASQINRSESFVNDLLDGEAEITAELAKELESTLGGSQSFWINREEVYKEEKERVESENLKKWIKSLPVKEMENRGWIKAGSDRINECLNFFGIKNLNQWNNLQANLLLDTSFRTSQSFTSDIGAVLTWLRYGELVADEMECDQWDEEKFEDTLNRIKPLTRKKKPSEFLPELIEECRKCGVAVVVAPTPMGCRASGATRVLEDGKSILLLSFRYLSDDHFWFTFFHEAGHIMMHRDGQGVILEQIGKKLHVDEKEKEANLFASEMLIPYMIQDELYSIRGNKRRIIQFAQKAGISPGIVVGQMQHRGIIDHKYLNSYKRRYNWDEINASL